MEESQPEPITRRGVVKPPLEQIRAEPWVFIGLAAIAGVLTAVIWKVVPVRKTLKAYGIARRVI